MRSRYLDITYRQGKPVAAYLYLVRQNGDVSVRTERHECGLLIDYTADNRPIGIEITSPSKVTLAALNMALAAVNQAPATAADLSPLSAA